MQAGFKNLISTEEFRIEAMPSRDPGVPKSANTSAPIKTIPIAISWDGVGDLLPGSLSFSPKATSPSRIEVVLPSLNEKCTGQITPSQDSRSGVWALACPGQKGATGTFQISSDGNGTCSGQDFLGRAVRCSFSERSKTVP